MRQQVSATLKPVSVRHIPDPNNEAEVIQVAVVTLQVTGLDPEVAKVLSRCALHGHILDVVLTCAQEELPLGKDTLNRVTGELVASEA